MMGLITCDLLLPLSFHIMTASDTSWLTQLGGRFIVFDGPDGSGKTTQFHRTVHAAEAAGLEVLEVREPGGTDVGEGIRQILLDPQYGDMDVRCEMLLYMASRAQLVREKILPALEAGTLVLADRFISSTLAYQGTAGGMPVEDIRAIGRIALGDLWPDLVIVFDVDQRTAMARMNPLLRQREFESDLDRMEQKGAAFHARVRQGYLDQAREDPQHYEVIDATADVEKVWSKLLEVLHHRAAKAG